MASVAAARAAAARAAAAGAARAAALARARAKGHEGRTQASTRRGGAFNDQRHGRVPAAVWLRALAQSRLQGHVLAPRVAREMMHEFDFRTEAANLNTVATNMRAAIEAIVPGQWRRWWQSDAS